MEIYILRDGKETGPFTEENTQSLLKQGAVLISDLAWQPGMAQWLPLHSVLYPAPAATSTQRPPPPPVEVAPALAAEAPPAEPATAKQKAFLTYVGIPFTAELTKEQAALAVNDAMENPKDPARLARWNDERLRLHPELFAAEIKAKKENRANHFHEIAQREGAGFFTNVTKAHAQVLVGYLDVHHPNWDANEAEATRSYFFPAIAEKFPQLVEKSAKGKFKFGSATRVAPELTHRVARPAAAGSSFPIGAIIRGLVFGGVALAAIYFGAQFLNQPTSGKKKAPVSLADLSTSKKIGSKPEDTMSSAPTNAETPANSGLVASTETPPPMTAPAPGDPAPGDPAMSATPTAPVELTPIAPPAPEPVPVQPRTTFMITKSTEVTLPFGRAVLRPGTLIKILAVEGTRLKIKYVNDIVFVPISSTDFQSTEAAPAPGATLPPAAPATPVDPLAPPPGMAPAPGTAPATAPKPPTSLF